MLLVSSCVAAGCDHDRDFLCGYKHFVSRVPVVTLEKWVSSRVATLEVACVADVDSTRRSLVQVLPQHSPNSLHQPRATSSRGRTGSA